MSSQDAPRSPVVISHQMQQRQDMTNLDYHPDSPHPIYVPVYSVLCRSHQSPEPRTQPEPSQNLEPRTQPEPSQNPPDCTPLTAASKRSNLPVVIGGIGERFHDVFELPALICFSASVEMFSVLRSCINQSNPRIA
jgi:hypothetical protein